MKVIEAGTDRSAEVNIYVEEVIKPLREYGEYVAADQAVCCYVPIEEGNKPRIIAKFTGTTKSIMCDAFIDGIHRKCSPHESRGIRCQKNKKIEIDKFLFTKEDQTIDSTMMVAPLDERITITTQSESDSVETIGTIELRLYVTRQLNVVHHVKDTKKYYISDKSSDADTGRIAHYSQIPPTFQLDIDRNSASISKKAENYHNKKMDSPRPGSEPWAIFRFHYRSQEVIGQHDLQVTFDAESKIKIMPKPRILSLDPVDPLVAETELSENGGSPTRSPVPTQSPFFARTPARGDSPVSKPSTPIHDRLFTKANLAAKTMDSTVKPIKNFKDRVFNNPSEETLTMRSSYTAGTDDADSPTSASAIVEPTPTPTPDPRGRFNSLFGNTAMEGPAATMSTKRSLSTTEAPPGSKRPKPLSIVPSNELSTPHNGSKVTVSGSQFFDNRQKLAHLRKVWLEKKQELAAISAEMADCKRCVDEELDRIRREVAEEEDAFTEELKHYSNDNKALQ